MSRDFATLFLQKDFANFNTPSIDKQTEYRLLNAPLAKYLIGLGWWSAGYTLNDLNKDWEWPKTWDENLQANNFPHANLLVASRALSAELAALSTVLLFYIGYEAKGKWVGLIAALLLGGNALVLLHGRRTMAEGSALFFALGAVWLSLKLLKEKKWIWVISTGIVTGLAIAAKQTNIATIPMVGLAAATAPIGRATLVRWATITIAVAATFFFLNPILYQQPIATAQAMLVARNKLASEQVATTREIAPKLVLDTPTDRLQAAILQAYWQPLAYEDFPVYIESLKPQIKTYEANLLHTLSRNLIVGANLFALTLIGLVFSGKRILQTRSFNKAEALCWVWGFATLGLTLLVIPLNWQRYFMPLVSLMCLFAAFGLEAIVAPVWQNITKHS